MYDRKKFRSAQNVTDVSFFVVNVNDDVHVDAQPSNNNDVEIEPFINLDNPQSKNQCYDKRDFVARKHGREREPWVQKPIPIPPKP